MDWLTNNIPWIFSGAGIFLITLFFKNKNGGEVNQEQNIKSGDNCNNTQVNKSNCDNTNIFITIVHNIFYFPEYVNAV